MHASPRRVATCPPKPVDGSTLETLWRWLDGGWSHVCDRAGPPAGQPARSSLTRVRTTFLEGVADIPGLRSADLQRRIRAASGLQDLWHLRAEIFALVSHTHDQAEAQQRLASLNRHFPTRSARSGFASLDAAERTS